MTQQQWDKHAAHFNEHITWPATKQQIIEACQGQDVDEEVMNELKNLPEKEYENEAELKDLLIKES